MKSKYQISSSKTNLINLLLCLVCCFCLSVFANAQGNKSVTTSKEIVPKEASNLFAYSYGVILGDNLKKIGLTFDLFSMNKLKEGINAFTTSKDPKLVQGNAQKALTKKLSEIQANSTAKEKGENSTDLSKASLDDFYVNYGIVIAENWKTFGMSYQEVSMQELEDGVRAVVTGVNLKFNAQKAQVNVSNKFQQLQQAKSEQQIIANDAFMMENKKRANVISLASGIQYEILKKGQGTKATNESTVTTHYHGTLISGDVFDSSVNQGKPISFALSGVIKGWQEIIPMMKLGAKWKIYVPPHMGYGNRQRGNKIPANSLLIFEIELISIDN